jgi:hypothetical protein
VERFAMDSGDISGDFLGNLSFNWSDISIWR